MQTVTYDASATTMRLYVDGVEIGDNSEDTLTANTNRPLRIGAGATNLDTPQFWFNGKIDEVAYWNTELSDNAIAALYNSSVPSSVSLDSVNYTNSGNLVMYYQFQENLNDSEGSFDLTNYNNNIGSSNYVAETID